MMCHFPLDFKLDLFLNMLNEFLRDPYRRNICWISVLEGGSNCQEPHRSKNMRFITVLNLRNHLKIIKKMSTVLIKDVEVMFVFFKDMSIIYN